MWIYLALATAILWGLQKVLMKDVLKKYHASEYMTMASIAAFVCLLPFITNVSMPDKITLVAIFTRTLFMAIALLSFTRALRHMPISNVTPLANLTPVFAFLMGITLLSEKVQIHQIIAVFIIMGGSYVLDTEGKLKDWRSPLRHLLTSKYVHYIAIYAFFRALAAVLSKPILTRTDSFNLLFFHTLFIMLIFLTLTFLVYGGKDDLKKASKNWTLLLVIAIFAQAGSFTSFLAYAVPESKVSIIMPIISLQTLVSMSVGGKLFKEEKMLPKLAATILLLIGVTILII